MYMNPSLGPLTHDLQSLTISLNILKVNLCDICQRTVHINNVACIRDHKLANSFFDISKQVCVFIINDDQIL